MPIFARQGQIVVKKSTGQQFDVQDGDIELTDDFEILRQNIPQATGRFPQVESVMETVGRAVVPPTIGLLGSVMPGPRIVKLAAEAGASAFGEKMVGGSSEDVLAAALIPGVMRGGIAAGKGVTRGATGFVMPAALREAGVEVFKGKFTGPVSKGLFEIARRQGSVPTPGVIGAIDRAIAKEASMSTPTRGAVKILENFKNKFAAAPDAAYDDLIDEVQRLHTRASEAFAKGNHVTGKAISGAASQILNEMDNISPAIKEANKAYRRERSVQQLTKELRKSNPGVAVRNLMESDGLVSGAFAAKEQAQILKLTDEIGRISTGATVGAANRAIMAAGEVVAAALTNPGGRSFLRMLMKEPNQINRTSMAALAQFMRGLTANPAVGMEEGQ